jgi:hypothetical protein
MALLESTHASARSIALTVAARRYAGDHGTPGMNGKVVIALHNVEFTNT